MATRSLEYDIEFFNSTPRIELLVFVQINEMFENIKRTILNFSKKHKRFYIFTPHEKIISDKLQQEFIELLDSLNSNGFEVYLCMTTTSTHKYFLHPLCSVLHYTGDYSKDKNQVGKKNVNEKIKILDLKLYSKTDKIHKGIFSIRKVDHFRELFYKEFDKKFDGIFRYSRMDRGNNSGDYKPVSFDTLIKEYNQSYVSFLFETGTNDSTISFSEKSMIALLSRTLPILFISKPNQIEEFNNMGFYFLNEFFDYTTVSKTASEKDKVNLFLKCIDKFNKLSIDEVINIYKEKTEQIEKNHTLIKEMLLKEIDYTQEKIILTKPLL